MLEVGGGERVFWETCGNPLGKAATNRFAYARASAGDDRDGMPACG